MPTSSKEQSIQDHLEAELLLHHACIALEEGLVSRTRGLRQVTAWKGFKGGGCMEGI